MVSSECPTQSQELESEPDGEQDLRKKPKELFL